MVVEDKIVKRIDELINKGNKLIDTAEPELQLGVLDTKYVVHRENLVAWWVQIQNCLNDIDESLGSVNAYLREFGSPAPPLGAYISAVERYREFLRAVKEDILGGYLRKTAAEDKIKQIDELVEKGNEVLATRKPIVTMGDELDQAKLSAWRLRIQNFLVNLLGRDHSYVKSLSIGQKIGGYQSYVKDYQQILQAVKEDIISGVLRTPNGEQKNVSQKDIQESESVIPEETKNTFKRDHPMRCVFIMMQFSSKIGDHLDKLIERIRSEITKYQGLEAVVASDKNYSSSDWLWNNVCVYMELSEFGIAVLENFRQDSMNPNIAVEFGYMQGLRKKVLLLKEKGFDRINSDLLGRLWKPFDVDDLTTLDKAIEEFFGIDLGIPKKRI